MMPSRCRARPEEFRHSYPQEGSVVPASTTHASPVLSQEVRAALADGRPVVALESTILAHGLPRGENRRVADEIEARVRAGGAVPATIAVLDGAVRVGLRPAELDRLCDSDDIAKLSVRDLGPALALGRDGATTVASTSALAHRVGIEVFATGGLGGVHRGAAETFDISADLRTLARVPVLVVCAGVKSILDVAATLEYLETSSIPVLGFASDFFAGFYRRDSGFPVPWRVDDPAAAAAVFRAHRRFGSGGGLVVSNPVPADAQLDPRRHDRVLADGLAEVAGDRITGKDVTPALLAYFHAATGGDSLTVNVALVLANAELAGRIAVELATTAAAT